MLEFRTLACVSRGLHLKDFCRHFFFSLIKDWSYNTGCHKIDATHLYDNDLLLRQETPCHLV